MQRLTLNVTDKTMERFGDTWRFRVRGNGILFEMFCQNHELTQRKISEINEHLKNSMRYVKHYGGYPDKSADQKDMEAAMNKLSQTSTGIAVKIKSDPLPEFVPFSL